LRPFVCALGNVVFPAFDIFELDQEKFPLAPISHKPVIFMKNGLVRNFEMTCYYVASNLPAQLPAQFSAEQAVEAG
ncbi:MAG TPA: hypothetical protein VFY67_06640, partial [Pyrinomonadaceae bacterium]|nr:hypothetical protein [Pyrinomonadaceae bacterium]